MKITDRVTLWQTYGHKWCLCRCHTNNCICDWFIL